MPCPQISVRQSHGSEILMVFRRTLQRFLRLMKLQPELRASSSQKEMPLVKKINHGKKRDAQIGRLLQISVCIFWCQVSLVFFSCHFLRETFVSGVTSPVNESFNGRPWIGCYRGDSSNAWMLHSTLVGATGIATAWRCKQLADFYRRSVGACRCFPEKLKVLPKMKTDIFVV